MIFQNLKKYTNYLFYSIILVLFVWTRIFDIQRPYWKDEYISLETTSVNILENPLFNTVSTNLPLYYYVLQIGVLIGLNETNLRYVSLAISCFTLILIFYFHKRTKNNLYLILIFLVFLSPLQIYYSQELRTYILTQFLLVLVTYYLFKIENKISVNYKFFSFITFLALISHYTSFIFLFSIASYLTFFKKWTKPLIFSLLIAFIGGMAVVGLISNNKNFDDSIDKTALNMNFQNLSFFDIRENILRTNELLTIYYNFGLHYYRFEPEFLGFFKKFMYFNFLLFAFLIFRYKIYQNNNFKMIFTTFAFIIIFSILFDLLGFIDFGGRYQFPFHFLYLIGLAFYLKILGNFNKLLLLIILLVFLGTYAVSNFCLWQNLDIFIGNGDPQGVIFTKCYQKISG